MARIQTMMTPWMTLVSNVAAPSDNGFTPATGYMPSGPLVRARMTIETRNRIGTIEVIGASNFCQNELSPNATGTNLGSTWISSATMTTPGAFTDLSTTSDDYQRARFGFVTRNASGTGTGTSLIEARARIDVLIDDSLQRMAVPFMLVYSNSTSDLFFPATGWYPAVSATRGRALYEVQARSDTLNFAPAFQLTNDPTSPGTTGTILGSYTENPSGVQYPAGFITISSPNQQFVRFGWLVKRTSGTNPAQALIGGEFEFGRDD